MTWGSLALTLAKTGNSHPFLQDLEDHASPLVRSGLEHIPLAHQKVSESRVLLQA